MECRGNIGTGVKHEEAKLRNYGDMRIHLPLPALSKYRSPSVGPPFLLTDPPFLPADPPKPLGLLQNSAKKQTQKQVQTVAACPCISIWLQSQLGPRAARPSRTPVEA